MSKISAEDYYEFHESREELAASYPPPRRRARGYIRVTDPDEGICGVCHGVIPGYVGYPGEWPCECVVEGEDKANEQA